MAVLGKAYVEVRADLSAFPADLRAKLEAAFKEATAGITFEDLDKKVTEEGTTAADDMAEEFDKESRKKMKPAGENAGKSWFSGLKGIFPLLMSSFLPVLIGWGLEIGSYLLPAVAAFAAAIPAAASIAIGAFAAVAIATHGVGDAIKAAFSGDPQKLTEAMKGLAPAARDFVQQINAARPALHGLQQDVQQAFFVQLEGSITRLITALLPALHEGLVNTATDIGKIGAGVVSAITSRAGDIQSIFLGIHYSLSDLIPVAGQLTGALISVTSVAGPFVEELVSKLAAGLSEFAGSVEDAANSGALANFFSTGLQLAHALWGTLVQVGGVVQAILSALSQTGGQGLGVLTSILKELNVFFSTPAGKGALVTIFQLLNTALQALSQIIQPLLDPLGVFIQEVGQNLINDITLLTPGFVQLVKAIAPMLPMLTQLLPLVTLLVTGASQILDFLTKSPGAVQAVIGAWAAYKVALMAIAAWEAIVDAEDPLTWIVLAVAAIVAGAILIYENWDKVKALFSDVWGAIKDAASAVGGWFSSLGGAIGNFLSQVGGFFAALPGNILNAVMAIPGLLVQMIEDAANLVAEALGFAIGLWLGLLIKLPGEVWNALISLPPLLLSIFESAGTSVLNHLVSWGAQALGFMAALPGRIWNALLVLPTLLVRIFDNAMNGAKSSVTRGGNSIIDFAKSLPGRLGNFFANAGSAILNGLKSGINGVIRSFNAGIDHAAGPLHVVLPHIPLLASGGLFDSPTLAVIGEAGPEAVIPMGNPKRARQLADQSGLTQLLSRGGSHVEANVTVYLGTEQITDILDQRIDTKMDDVAGALSSGERTGF